MTVATQHNPGASAEAIQHHYDVSNEFYRLWLDSASLAYSCALWEDNDTLESAQLRKLDHHIHQSKAPGAGRVLDVGCGWGGLLQRLTQVYGVGHAVGLTLSRQQQEHVIALDNPRVEVRLENWLDHVPEAPYDAIVSIGAFEHFARLDLSGPQKVAAYRRFFEHCHGWLKPGACMSLQSIVYGNAGREDFSAFFDKEIFPESNLPHIAEIAQGADRLFELVALRNDREHYERTFTAWRQRLKAHWQEAVRLVGEKTVQRYDKYFQYCIIGFHAGTMGLARVTLRRIDAPRRGADARA